MERILAKLNHSKASEPDQIRNWLLKEYSDLVAFPVAEILNASVNEQRLPAMRKGADVTPLPKKKQVQILEKDLRPISLATAVSKVAEGFIVDDYVQPLVLKELDHRPYGVIPNSTTTLALISMLQHWSLGTDGNGSTVGTLLFDYRRAFDFIDHSIVITKLYTPRSLSTWFQTSYLIDLRESN